MKMKNAFRGEFAGNKEIKKEIDEEFVREEEEEIRA